MKMNLRYLWYVLRHKWYVFAECVRHHLRHGPHHWEHWIINAGDFSECAVIPTRYVRSWYSKQRDRIRLHPVTRYQVEHLIGLR